MPTLESIRETSRMIGEILSPAGNGDFTLIATLYTEEDSVLYATADLVCDGEDVFTPNSLRAVVEVACRALYELSGGHILLCHPDPQPGRDMPHLRAWRLLAGEAVPLSAVEMKALHSGGLGGSEALPARRIGCMDAYPVTP